MVLWAYDVERRFATRLAAAVQRRRASRLMCAVARRLSSNVGSRDLAVARWCGCAGAGLLAQLHAERVARQPLRTVAQFPLDVLYEPLKHLVHAPQSRLLAPVLLVARVAVAHGIARLHRVAAPGPRLVWGGVAELNISTPTTSGLRLAILTVT